MTKDGGKGRGRGKLGGGEGKSPPKSAPGNYEEMF